jgi:hypothetical protein
MKKPYRLVWIVFGSLLLSILPVQHSSECISLPEWEQYRMRFFEPGLDGMAELSPFYYTQRWFYNDTDDPENADVQRNCLEWQTRLGASVSLADIETVLYQDGSADRFLNAWDAGRLAAVYPGNSFVQQLLKPEWKPVLEYLVLVKKLEFVQSASDDPWYEPAPDVKADTTFFDWKKYVATLCDESLTGLEKHKNDGFLFKRYAYQAVLCQRYYGSDTAAIALFDRCFSATDTTVLRAWALVHKAECMLMQGDSLGFNLALAQAFDGCNSRRKHTVNLFVSRLWEFTLVRATTNRDKALVTVMKAVQYPGPGLALLKKIAAFDPACPYIPLVVSREINKLEDWLLTEKLTGIDGRSIPESFYDVYDGDQPQPFVASLFNKKVDAWRRNNRKKDFAYLHEMLSWLETIQRSHAWPQHRNFLRLATAHLHFLSGNYTSAEAVLAGIDAQASPRLLLQRDMEKLLLMPHLKDLKSMSAKTEMVRLLRLIQSRAQYLDAPGVQMSRLHFYCCHALFQVGDIPAAGLYFNKAYLTSNEGGTMHSWYHKLEFFDAHASQKDMERLVALSEKGAKNDFEGYLLEMPAMFTDQESRLFYFPEDTVTTPLPERNDLLELQGTIAFRDGDLMRSKAIFEQLPADFWTDDNTLETQIFGDGESLPFDKKASKRGGKIDIVRRMLELEAACQTATGNQLAEYCYQLGNGWFHCSYWGRSWYMFSYNRSYDDDDSPEIREAGNFPGTPDVRKYGGVYFRFDRALYWYRRALAARPDKELAAKIEYMMADCDRYVRIMRKGSSDYYEYAGKPLDSSPLFRQWARRYGNTATFSERMAHCPELKTYLGR